MKAPDFGWTPEDLKDLDISVQAYLSVDRNRAEWWRDMLIDKFRDAYEGGYLGDKEISLLACLPKPVQERLVAVYTLGSPVVHLGLMPSEDAV